MSFNIGLLVTDSSVRQVVSQSATTLVINTYPGDGTSFATNDTIIIYPFNSSPLLGIVGKVTGTTGDQLTIDITAANRLGSPFIFVQPGYQIAFINTTVSAKTLIQSGGGNSVTWGTIIGTISDQADLQNLVDSGVTHTKNIANNANTTIFSVIITPGTTFGAIAEMALEGFDGTDFTNATGTIALTTENKNGVISNVGLGSQQYSAFASHFTGSLATLRDATFTNTNATPSVFSINPGDLGSSFSGGYLRVKYHLKILTGQTITYL